MSKETTDTLGNQKKYNYALRANMTRDEFIAEVTRGLLPPPAYFPINVMMNKEGYESFEEVLDQGMKALSPEAFETAANETGAIILDTRDAQTFAAEFIPNAINIGIGGSFAPWVGALITDIKQPILLVTEEGREEEVITRLARVGYDSAIGYLKGGIAAWKAAGKETDTIKSINAGELAELSKNRDALNLLDVRKTSEYYSEHLVNAYNVPLDYVNDQMSTVDKSKTQYVYCASGYRSMIFVSILKARGYDNLVNVTGGFKALKKSGKFDLSPYVCASTMQ
jgi:rhodanese-related sulfurtransferase